ncbi:MAG: DNA internalization-related competence protein ComEC/Rec2 [Gammaproteobacteria bacterium]
MRAWTLAFSLGLILCGFVPRVPAFVFIAGALAGGVLLHVHRLGRLPGAFLLGCGWLLLYAHQSLAALWPERLEGVDVWAEGIVWSLPQQTERSLRFEFHIEHVCEHGNPADCDLAALPEAGQTVLINLYQPLPIAPGQRWRLQLRLQRPHGFANPGGFDYEAWLMQNGIRATGYVREHRGNVLVAQTARRAFTQLRHALVAKIDAVEGLRYPHLIRALTLGDHYGISDDEWELFRQTGTNHLIVISGMHVALIALLLYRLGWWLATRWTRLLLVCPAPQVAAGFALLGAWCYSGLAGLSLPVQRAFVMAAVLFAGRLLRRQTSSVDALCLALALILALDPLAPQNAGFWLSYCAVAVLLLILRPDNTATHPGNGEGNGRDGRNERKERNERRGNTGADDNCHVAHVEHDTGTGSSGGGKWRAAAWKWLARGSRVLWLEWRTQWFVSLGLLPILLLFFQQISPLAPLVNMPAIPYVGILIVPLALCAVALLWIWPAVAEPLLRLTDWLLHGYMLGLAGWVQTMPLDLVTLPALPLPALVLLCGATLAALFLRQAAIRFAATLLVPLLFIAWPQPQLAEGALHVAVLDTGQGLAVVVGTRGHQLLYDTGPYFSSRFDAGSDVVVPYLRQRNIHRLDTVIVSHADGDHAGGLPGVAAAYPDARYLGSAPEEFPLPGAACTAGQQWNWDGVDFRMLHPDRPGYERNDSSCVLQITSGNSSVLLPGDIERASERHLLAQRVLQPVTLLIAPHHGSASSSTVDFVATTHPQVVVYASGYRNRFGHPRADVRARYVRAGSAEYLTSRSGAVEFELDAGGLKAVHERRRERRRFWGWPL